MATAPVEVNQHSSLFLTIGRGLPEISSDGLSLVIRAETAHGPTEIMAMAVTNYERSVSRDVQIDLGHLPAGVIELDLLVGAGPANDPRSDWLSISELVIGPRHEIDLLRARAFHALRVENEIAHFASVYDHEIFKARKKRAAESTTRPAAASTRPNKVERPSIDRIDPEPGEDVYHYAHRLLAASILSTPPNFHQRLADMAVGGDLSVASFCCGTAQIEASLARSTQERVGFTLVDINQGLLDQAALAFPENCAVRTIEQDVNALSLEPGVYDVAIFVSGVHHVIELEHVWQQVHQSLTPGGELWLIGEQIGPNGNRLDPDCIAEANRVFGSLPEEYRRNAFTKEIDSLIPNTDLSESTFEGIRSDDIERTLGRHFLPVHVYKRNCFLWRVVNQAYFDNFDLSRAEDVNLVRSVVKAEVDYFLRGGRPTELHAVYKAIG